MDNTEQQTALAPLEEITAVEAFTGDALDSILKRIEDEVSGFVPDLTSAKGRRNIASMARKVAKSKVVIENLGKGLVSEWKEKAKKVDASRRQSREFLDALRDKVRKPLTDWEAEEERKAEAERQRIADEAAAEQARIEAERAEAQRLLDEREAEIARREEEARAAAEAQRVEAEKKAEAERLQHEANERAKREAEEQIQKTQEDAARRVAEEKLRAENAERDRIAAEERAKIEQEQAVQRAKDEAEAEARRKEAERLEAEAAKRRAEEARQADEDHRRNINRAALSGMMQACGDEALAKRIISSIARGQVPNVTINY